MPHALIVYSGNPNDVTGYDQSRLKCVISTGYPPASLHLIYCTIESGTNHVEDFTHASDKGPLDWFDYLTWR